MKTCALISRKGGAGKSTLTLHLAALASETSPRVIVIDTDDQKTTSWWWESRGKENPALIECGTEKIRQALDAARKHEFDWVFIDTPPHGPDEISQIAQLADICIIPCRPNPIDLEAISQTLEITGRDKSLVVLNQCPPQRNLSDVHRVIQARRVLVELGATVVAKSLTSRITVAQAIADGQGITECDPDGPAAAEFRDLWDHARQMLERGAGPAAKVA